LPDTAIISQKKRKYSLVRANITTWNMSREGRKAKTPLQNTTRWNRDYLNIRQTTAGLLFPLPFLAALRAIPIALWFRRKTHAREVEPLDRAVVGIAPSGSKRRQNLLVREDHLAVGTLVEVNVFQHKAGPSKWKEYVRTSSKREEIRAIDTGGYVRLLNHKGDDQILTLSSRRS
jgi:hypothetical protein